MKVLLINGSPRKEGNTAVALTEAANVLRDEGIETEIEWIGPKPIRGCTACGWCHKTGEGRCVFDDDPVNELLAKAADADGFIFGSPVYYAGANGTIVSMLDRMFYAGSKKLRHKPGAGVGVARRAGAIQAADEINKYFEINAMPVVSSTYWGIAFGGTPGESAADVEGLATMRNLAHQMAWLMKCIDAGKAAGIEPYLEDVAHTNVIRDDLKA